MVRGLKLDEKYLRIYGILALLFILLFVMQVLLVSGLSNASLTFNVENEDGEKVEDVLVVLQGVSDPTFLESKETDANGIVVFENVPLSAIYVYSFFKTGYKALTGNVFLTSERTLPIVLEDYEEGDWWDYYENDGIVDIYFKSFDEDVYYEGGEELNYEIRLKNIANENVRLTQDSIKLLVYDDFRDSIIWGQLNPELLFDITLRPNGYLKINTNGADVEITVSNALVTYEGSTVSINEDEYISITIQTRDNIIPDYLYGNFHIVFFGDYVYNGNTRELFLETQDFHIENEGADVKVENLNIQTFGSKKFVRFDIVNSGEVDLGGIFYEISSGTEEIKNEMAIRLKEGKKIIVNSQIEGSGSLRVFVDPDDIIDETNEGNNIIEI